MHAHMNESNKNIKEFFFFKSVNDYIHEWIPAQLEEVSKQLDFNIPSTP